MEPIKGRHPKERIPVAFVVPRYGLMGGAESVVFEMAERIARMDPFRVHVLAHRWKAGGAPIEFHKIPVIRFPRPLQPLSFAYFADRWIRRHPHVLIHSHERILQMDLFTFHGIPHRTWIRNVRKKPLGLFDWATAEMESRGMGHPRLKYVLAVSSLVKTALLRSYPFPESRVCVLHPGISLKRFAALNRDACRGEVRKRHGLKPSDTVLLFVGMNFDIKRLDLVMEGMAEALKHKPDVPWKLLVAGKGNPRSFEALAKRLGILERVVFSGPVTPVEPYYLAADLFVMPSWMDTFGMAVLEAMAAGLPVVITPTVGAGDLVETGRHGFILSESPTPEALGAVLRKLADPRLREVMGKNARKKAAALSWENVVDRLARLYRDIALEKGRPPAAGNCAL